SVMEVPASNCVRSITLMPASAGRTMVCVCGTASISHTSSTSHRRERPTPYTFLQGLVGWTKAAFRERIGRNPRWTVRIPGFCATIATGARIVIELVERGRERQGPDCRDPFGCGGSTGGRTGSQHAPRGLAVRLGDVKRTRVGGYVSRRDRNAGGPKCKSSSPARMALLAARSH